jgi:hypothetical protein
MPPSVTSGTSSPTDLALAVLAALGKQLDGRPVDDRSHWWDRARSWTVGHRIEHLVVDRAHTLPAALIHRLLGLAQAAQAATLWLIDAVAYRTTPALTRLGACVLGLLTRDIDEVTGAVIDVELHPDVKFSLGIEQDLVAAKRRDTQLAFALLLKLYGRFGRSPSYEGVTCPQDS